MGRAVRVRPWSELTPRDAGILRGDIVVRRAGWLARALRESCRRRLHWVLLYAERRLAMALATAYYHRLRAAYLPAGAAVGRAGGACHSAP